MTERTGEEEAKQADNEEIPEPAYNRQVFTALQLPEAVGNVPKELEKIPKEEQTAKATNLLNFLKDPNSTLLEINADESTYVVLVHIPNTSKVKICYGLGVGASGIGRTSPLDGKFLTLTGDGGGAAGTPTPFLFSTTTRTVEKMGSMTEKQFTTALSTKGPTYSWPLMKTSQVTSSADIMKMAPIPAFLVYDGFDSQLDAADIYERLIFLKQNNIIQEEGDLFQHLKEFLLACLQSHTQANPSPSIAMEDLMAPPSIAAKNWASKKFDQLFPTLTTANPQNPQQQPTTLQQQGVQQQDTLATLLASLIPALQNGGYNNRTSTTNQNLFQEEKKETDMPLNMSEREQNQLCTMCGLVDGSDIDLLPIWIRECAAKGMTDTYRQNVIRAHIMENSFYEDAEVPLTSALLKMIVKRAWMGKDGNIKKPSLVNAMEGLTPFTCAFLDDDEVAQINAQDEIIDLAKSVTVQDLTRLKKSLKAKVPNDGTEFFTMIKAYANLIFALFSSTCPLFIAIKTVIDALKQFSRPAREAFTTRTKAQILWILLLQSRNFASGNMQLLCEFTTMQANLCGKNVSFTHAELPSALLEEKTTTPIDSGSSKGSTKRHTNDMEAQEKKKPKGPNKNQWHPKLRAALTIPLDKAKHPSLTALANFCNINLKEVWTTKRARCTSNSFLGRCKDGESCTRSHELPTDSEVEDIFKLLQPFLAKPEGMLKG